MMMRFAAAFGWLIGGLILAGGTQAAEPPHLQLVRGLRQRGYHDLALEYLEKLQRRKKPPLPDDLRDVLPLEIALCRAAAADQKSDVDQRLKLLDSARATLAAFVNNPKHAKHPRLASAKVDLARVLLTVARTRAATVSEAKDKGKAAREAASAFDAAAQAFSNAAEDLKNQWNELEVDPKDPASQQKKREALGRYLDALYHHGLVLFEKGEILIGVDDLKSGEANQEAAKIFETLAEFRNRHTLGWQGLAWLGRSQEGLDDRKRDEAYRTVLAARNLPQAVPAQRLVHYFRILSAFRTPGGPEQRQQVRQAAEQWLTQFAGPRVRNRQAVLASREGQHIRYMLALLYRDELARMNQTRRRAESSQQLVDRALAHLEALERGGDFATLAKRAKFSVLRLSGRVTSKAIHELATFDECLLRANLEYAEAEEANLKLQAAKTDEEKQQLRQQAQRHIRDMLAAIHRGITILPPRIPIEDWERAFALLYLGYQQTGDIYRAAVTIDYLARNSLRPENGRQYAAVALRLYRQIAASNQADRSRLIGFARWMVEKWPDAVETDAAREVLGYALIQQNKLAEAAAMWEKVSSKSPSYAECSYRAGLLNWSQHVRLTRKEQKPIQTPTPERAKAVALLQRAIAAFAAQKKNPEPPLAIRACAALASIYTYLGQTDQVLKLTEPLVAKIEKGQLPENLPPGTDTEILGLALRAYVSNKNIPAAMKVLRVLQKQGEGADLGGGLPALLRDLGRQLRSQIALLEEQGEPARQQLERTKQNFREFLGHLETIADLPVDLREWIGDSYVGLGDFDKAAEIYGAVPQQGNVRVYRQCQLKRISAMRRSAASVKVPRIRARRLAEVDAELKRVMANDWAKRHPQFMKERILLLQDRGFYSGPSGAIAQWDRFVRAIEPYIDRSPALRSLYHEAQFHLIECRVKEANLLRDAAARTRALRQIAQSLVALKRNDYGGPEFQPLYEELLARKENRELKAEFDKLLKPGS